MDTFLAPSRGTQRAAAALLALALVAPVSTPAQSAPAGAERAAADLVSVKTVRDVTADLSAPAMEGRGTAQHGGDVAARYIADRFSALGLRPAGEGGTFLQPVLFRTAEVLADSRVSVADTSLAFGKDFVVAPPAPQASAELTAGLVFAAYGMVSKDLGRDDLKALDVSGKAVVVLAGKPPAADAAAWKAAGGTQGAVMAAASRGAAAILLAFADADAGEFAEVASYLGRRRVGLASAKRPEVKLPPVLLVSPAAAARLVGAGGVSLPELRRRADAGEFVSRDLGASARIALTISRGEGTSSNVAGVLEGSDPKLKTQAVVYTAHYDAYGSTPDGRFYPGAADNALGVAEMMAIAEAMAKLPARPRRSVVFLAVTGEEYGLLGSEHWVQNPTWPLDRVAANVNFDGIGTEVFGPVERIVAFGGEFSDLGSVAEAASKAVGASVIPDPMPEERAFYRSDQYAFAKRGVPALNVLGAPGGDLKVWIDRATKWLATDYHQTTDVIRPEWNWEGARTVAVVGLLVGLRVANADAAPAWLPASPFQRPAAAAAAAR